GANRRAGPVRPAARRARAARGDAVPPWPEGCLSLTNSDYPGWLMTYLDHAATTPMHPEAVAAMTALMAEAVAAYGNASSLHASGRRARRVVEEAREEIGAALGARPSEVIFT